MKVKIVEDEEQKDVWPGDLIGIKEQTSEAGDDVYLVEVPKVAYEEVVPDAQAWVDTVLADTAVDTETTVKQIDESIAVLASERAIHEQSIADIISQINVLEDRRTALIEAAEEVEWMKPVRDILLPHADGLRKMARYLGRRVVEVGLNNTGRMIHALNDVDGEIDALTEPDG